MFNKRDFEIQNKTKFDKILTYDYDEKKHYLLFKAMKENNIPIYLNDLTKEELEFVYSDYCPDKLPINLTPYQYEYLKYCIIDNYWSRERLLISHQLNKYKNLVWNKLDYIYSEDECIVKDKLLFFLTKIVFDYFKYDDNFIYKESFEMLSNAKHGFFDPELYEVSSSNMKIIFSNYEFENIEDFNTYELNGLIRKMIWNKKRLKLSVEYFNIKKQKETNLIKKIFKKIIEMEKDLKEIRNKLNDKNYS